MRTARAASTGAAARDRAQFRRLDSARRGLRDRSDDRQLAGAITPPSRAGLHRTDRSRAGQDRGPDRAARRRVIRQQLARGIGTSAADSCDAAATKAAILAGSFTPGALSTPDDTSTCRAPVSRIASATFSGVSPPASIQGRSQWRRASSRQSKASPLPPGRSAPFGGLASIRIWSATRRIVEERGQIALVGHAHRLHHRQAIARPDLGHPVGRFVAVQLQHVQRHRLDDGIQRRVVGIDHQRHLGQPHRARPAPAARASARRQMARRFRQRRRTRHRPPRPPPRPRHRPRVRRPQILTRTSPWHQPALRLCPAAPAPRPAARPFGPRSTASSRSSRATSRDLGAGVRRGAASRGTIPRRSRSARPRRCPPKITRNSGSSIAQVQAQSTPP